MSKFTDSLSKTGTFIQNNKKPLLYVGGAIAVVVVATIVIGSLKKLLKGQDVLGSKFNLQPVDPSKTSISENTAKNYAESLYKAFNYGWGTDKDTIEEVFGKINSEDFKMVYNAFGERTYSSVNGGTPSGSPIGLDNPVVFGDNPNLNLLGWLDEELDWADYFLKKKIRPIIEGAGFTLG